MQEAGLHPRLDRQHELFLLAETQRGYFTAAQARALGYAYQVQQHHRETGNWLSHSQWRGIYRLRDYPEDSFEELVRLSLWSHNRQGKPQATVGFESAAVVHGIGGFLPSRIHLIVPRGFRKRAPPGVVLHRDDVSEKDATPFAGFIVTGATRTLADLAASTLSPEYLESAVRDAIAFGRVRRSSLEARAAQLPEPARGRLYTALATVHRVLT